MRSWTRRGIGFGAAAALLLGAAGLEYRHIVGRWYAPTPYDDLLHQIVDREAAARLGKSLARADVPALAGRLRQSGFSLSKRARGDASAGRVVEAGGWIVPETVALYASLAAEFS